MARVRKSAVVILIASLVVAIAGVQLVGMIRVSNQANPGSIVRVGSITVNRTGDLAAYLFVGTSANNLLAERNSGPLLLNLSFTFFRTSDDGEVFTDVAALLVNVSVSTPGFRLLKVHLNGTTLDPNPVYVLGDGSVHVSLLIKPPDSAFDGPMNLLLTVTPTS